MKKVFQISSIILLIFMLFSCSKNDNNDTTISPVANPREVKYEVKGNYLGQLTAVYYNASGVTVTETVTSLPWSKTLIVDPSVMGVGFTVASVVGAGGQTGQSVTANLYSGSVLKKTATQATDNNGYVNMGGLSIVF